MSQYFAAWQNLVASARNSLKLKLFMNYAKAISNSCMWFTKYINGFLDGYFRNKSILYIYKFGKDLCEIFLFSLYWKLPLTLKYCSTFVKDILFTKVEVFTFIVLKKNNLRTLNHKFKRIAQNFVKNLKS